MPRVPPGRDHTLYGLDGYLYYNEYNYKLRNRHQDPGGGVLIYHPGLDKVLDTMQTALPVRHVELPH